jgi:hypothetical protein
MAATLIHADRRMDMTMVKGAFRNYANVPKRYEFERFLIAQHSDKIL